MSVVRVRFAPSPTGTLHPGSLRTALINYLFARKEKGTFVLRVEDTDKERSKDSFLKEQMESLIRFGLNWDEGPDPADFNKSRGPYLPYRQSKRSAFYLKYAKDLVAQGKAYYCFLSEEEEQTQRAEAKKKKIPFRIKSPWRETDPKEVLEKLKIHAHQAVIRFKNVKKNYSFKDLVRGNIDFPSDMVGDFILCRSSGVPVYNFACAVDDYHMRITHVLRSEEHLANTLRQLIIFSGFGWNPPQYGHLSIILGEDKKKLSKRHGAQSVSELLSQGIMPQALLNFLSLMGWNPKTREEIFSLKDLEKRFFLEGLNPSPGIFNLQKLKWFNAQHIKKMSAEDLWGHLYSFIKTYHPEKVFKFPGSKTWKVQAINECRSGFSDLKEGVELLSFLAENYFYLSRQSLKDIKVWPQTLNVLDLWEKQLEYYNTIRGLKLQTETLRTGWDMHLPENKKALLAEEKNPGTRFDKPSPFLSAVEFTQICDKIKHKAGVGGAKLFKPLRAAVLGRTQGPELKTIVPLLQIKVLLKRVVYVKKQFTQYKV